MIVYIVIGTKENVFQDEIGGPFLPHPDGYYDMEIESWEVE